MSRLVSDRITVMKIVKRATIMFVANGIGLYLAHQFVPNVFVSLVLEQFALITLLLTLINLTLRPIVKLVLTPVIIITLGLGSILINAGMLYLLDFLLASITIEGFVALIITTIVISMVNLVIHFWAKII